MTTIEITDHIELTIKRPGGQVEVVKTPYTCMAPRQWDAISKATREAGRGECLSWKAVTKTVEKAVPSAADIAEQEFSDSRRAIYRAMDASAN